MKKNGFTLAEVLITLAIIGVVAMMTLPALINNTGEQQYKTGLKKGINTLTEAANMNLAVDGWDFSSLSTTAHDDDKQSLYTLLTKRTAVDYAKTGTASHDDGGAVVTTNCTVYLRDGSSITFAEDASIGDDRKTPQDDGLPLGVAVVLDTNGRKGPNQLSNCSGNVSATEEADNAGDCSDKTKRVIKDQFGLRLRGSVIVPNGEAARWAYDN